MDEVKTRKAAAAKAYWIQMEIAEGGTPYPGELDFLIDYADPTEHLDTREQELLRLTYMALQNDYVKDGVLEIADRQQRAELAKQLLDG